MTTGDRWAKQQRSVPTMPHLCSISEVSLPGPTGCSAGAEVYASAAAIAAVAGAIQFLLYALIINYPEKEKCLFKVTQVVT